MTRLGGWDEDPTFILRINVLPRGSGNRNVVKRLAREARAEARLSPHILKMVEGASSLILHLRPSISLASAIMEISAEVKRAKADKDQLGLFGGPLPAVG